MQRVCFTTFFLHVDTQTPLYHLVIEKDFHRANPSKLPNNSPKIYLHVCAYKPTSRSTKQTAYITVPEGRTTADEGAAAERRLEEDVA